MTMHTLSALALASLMIATSCTSDGTGSKVERVDAPPVTDAPLNEDRPTGPNVQGPMNPLAVVPQLEPSDANTNPGVALRDGTISITASCVTWVQTATSEHTTLAWPEGTVEYDAATETVVHTPPGGEPTSLQHGNEIDVRGTPATGTRNYLVAPSPDCPDAVWLVAEVLRPDRG